MSGLNHDWDRPYGPGHADFKHGAVEPVDFETEVNYTPRKKKKGCKRSKDGSACLFTKRVIRNQWYSPSREMWAINSVMVCERCGKHDWSTYGYMYRKEPVN